MPNTFCDIDGVNYALNYIKTPAIEGDYYTGTLMTETPIKFQLLHKSDGGGYKFEPKETPLDIQDYIRDAIFTNEDSVSKGDSDGFFS